LEVFVPDLDHTDLHVEHKYMILQLKRHTLIVNNDELKTYANDMLEGIQHVHATGVIHADVKLKNTLQTKSQFEEEWAMS